MFSSLGCGFDLGCPGDVSVVAAAATTLMVAEVVWNHTLNQAVRTVDVALNVLVGDRHGLTSHVLLDASEGEAHINHTLRANWALVRGLAVLVEAIIVHGMAAAEDRNFATRGENVI